MSHSPVLGSLTQPTFSRRIGGVTYRCQGRGALLSLPCGGHREDVASTEIFEKYIRDNVTNWFSWAQNNKLNVERMEELILVYGCTLVASWAAAANVHHTMDGEISLESRTLRNGGVDFFWSNIRGTVVHHNSHFNPVRTPVYDYSTCTNFLSSFCCMESKIHT